MTWGSGKCPKCGSTDIDVDAGPFGWDAACFKCGLFQSWRKGQYQWNGGPVPKDGER